MNEVKQARKVAEESKHPGVIKLLSQFVEKCPNCGAGRKKWSFDIGDIDNPPIKEMTGYDIVRYRCDCGCIFKKVEEK